MSRIKILCAVLGAFIVNVYHPCFPFEISSIFSPHQILYADLIFHAIQGEKQLNLLDDQNLIQNGASITVDKIPTNLINENSLDERLHFYLNSSKTDNASFSNLVTTVLRSIKGRRQKTFFLNLQSSKLSNPIVNNLDLNSDVYFLSDPTNSENIFELYAIKNTTISQQVNKTRWNKETISDYYLLNKVARRYNFQNVTIVATAQVEWPYTNEFNEDKTNFVGGIQANQFLYFAEYYNFSTRAVPGKGFVERSTENAGTDLKGMDGQVYYGEADISTASSEILDYRHRNFSFLQPTTSAIIWAFFQQPPSSSIRDIFINAFTQELWLTTFATWVLIVIAMRAITFVKSKMAPLSENDATVINEVVIWSIGFICQQGWHTCPESMSMKIVFLFTSVTGLVLYVAYSAALVSILSIKVIPIRSMEDVVKYRYNIYSDHWTYQTGAILKQLEKTGQIPKKTASERQLYSHEAINEILETKAAYFGMADDIYPALRMQYSDTQICEQISRVPLGQLQGAMFLAKGSPFVEFFNAKIATLCERGIQYRLLKSFERLTTASCEQTGGSSTQKEPLGYQDVFTAFVILFFGHCLSLGVFLSEKIFQLMNKAENGSFTTKWIM